MGRIVVTSFLSIDGVVQSPLSADEDRDDGFTRGGWVPPASDDVVDRFVQDTTVGAAGLLLGRRTYEILHAAWADADESDPAVAAMNRMPKYVVSSSGDGLDWANSHWVGGRVDGAVAGLDGVEGDLVVLGSARLVQGLAADDLVDEYRLLVFPVILGPGKRMFDEQGHLACFELDDGVVTPRGVALLTYRRSDPG